MLWMGRKELLPYVMLHSVNHRVEDIRSRFESSQKDFESEIRYADIY